MLDFAKIASEIKDAPAVEKEKNKVLVAASSTPAGTFSALR